MKALLLGFSLLVLTDMPGASAQQVKNKLASERLEELETSFQEGAELLVKENQEAGSSKSIVYNDAREVLLETVDALYLEGFISLRQQERFAADLKGAADNKLCPSGDAKACAEAISSYFKNFLNQHVKGAEPSCMSGDGLATAGGCCEGSIKLPNRQFRGGPSCAGEAQACSSHSECCTKFCAKESALDAKGQCAPARSCFVLNKKGEECGGANTYCELGLACVDINYASTGIGECSSVGASCSSNSECCSDSCSQGKCVQKRVCLDCARDGKKAAQGQDCCPGYIKNAAGRCIEDLPPPGSSFGAALSQPDSRSFWKVLAGILLPTAHASEKSKKKEPACVVNNLGLDKVQNRDYEKCIDSLKTIASIAKRQEKEAVCQAMKEEYAAVYAGKNCQRQDLADFSDSASRQEYRDAYQTSVLANVTKSDASKCEFNSFKDSWIAKSHMARNAEIALMGFEVAHSGKGEDMIISGKALEPGKPQYWGESIFTRAQRVALKLRENRSELVERFKRIDQEIECKCLATFGPEKMGKAEHFANYCSNQHDYVTQEGIEGENQGPMLKEGEANDTTVVDKVATGLTAEKLLVEWTGLRRDAQMVHFEANSKLEQELMDLSEFISNYPWVETPTLERKTHELYKFTVWWPSGFNRIVSNPLTTVDLGLGIMTADGRKKGKAIDGFYGWGEFTAMYEQNRINQPTWSTLVGLFNEHEELEPDVADPVVKKKYCLKRKLGVCWKRARDIRRDLLYPYFDNSRIAAPKKPKNRCAINGLATSCIKSVFSVDHTFAFGEEQELKGHPLLDVPLPATVGENLYRAEEVERGKTYAQLLDEGFVRHAMPAMKRTIRYVGGGKIHEKNYHPTMRYKIFRDPNDIKQFSINQGNWRPKKFNDFKSGFLAGVKNYAMCKNMLEDPNCQIMHSRELLKSNTETPPVGFGHLFEKEEDANDFANYVYEMHVVFPRMAAGGRIAYPTKGLNAYYQAMAHNLRLVGSLALRRGLEADQLYKLYLASWERRKKDYQGLGGADEGLGSRNVEVSQRVWDEIQTLEFENAASIENFGARLDAYEKSGEYSSAEIDSLRAVHQHAVRNLKEKEKREKYDKDYGATERGKRKIAASKGLASGLSGPLASMGLTLGGEEFGAGSRAPLPTMAKKDKEKDEKGKSAAGANNAAAAPTFDFTAASYNPKFGAGGAGYGFDSSSTESGPLNSGLSDSEAAAMVEAARQDSSLDEVLPGDSLWKVVSKAYKRNLSRVLVLKADLRKKERKEDEVAPIEGIKDAEKAELQKLLEEQAMMSR